MPKDCWLQVLQPGFYPVCSVWEGIHHHSCAKESLRFTHENPDCHRAFHYSANLLDGRYFGNIHGLYELAACSTFTAGTVAGTLIGKHYAHSFDEAKLERGFAILTWCIALSMLIKGLCFY